MSTVDSVQESSNSTTSPNDAASTPDEPAISQPLTNGEANEVDSRPEDALEEGEILELQAFIPRKEWIEQKIQFLEQLPPVDLFNNLEYLMYATPTPIPGLPTREQLDEWVKQHDAIEQEAEQFDSNDMKRLKKFAKAATQRNLSPADTDLIEVTLTTLLGLDRLIHLLRSRSDVLELTGLRLTWEEKRLGAWDERETIRKELEQFVIKAARWSPESYRPILDHQVNSSSSSINQFFDSPTASPVSAVSPRRNSVFSSSSKGMRPKMAEDLTREAGRYTTRIAAWKRNFIVPSGKALDSMIEKKPVPDAILDEQDKIEDNTRPMEALSRFAMEVVGQWKKADELYGELKKEQASATALHDDATAALQQHPSSTNDSTFVLRSQALQQRIANLTTLINPRLFPKPTHPSFPDQPTCNESVITALTQELQQTRNLIDGASAVAQEYHRRNELVGQIDGVRSHLERQATRLDECTRRLIEGAEAEDGDGSPLRLDSVDCLDSMKHGAYLAVLPIISSELDDAETTGNKHARTCRDAMRALKGATVDGEFSTSLDRALEQFEQAKEKAKAARDDATTKAARLRDVRKVWNGIGGTWKQLDSIKADLADRMERAKWLPIGQEQPIRSPMHREMQSWPDSSQGVASQLDKLAAGVPVTITKPLEAMKSSIGPEVSQALTGGADIISQYLENMRGMVHLSGVVTQQASTMTDVRREEMMLEERVDGLIRRFDDTRKQLSSNVAISLGAPNLFTQQIDALEQEHSSLTEEIPQFCSSLSTRIPFIGKPETYFKGPLRSSQLSFSTFLQSKGANVLATPTPFVLPLDVASLDHNVRSDANNLAISISTKGQELARHRDYLQLAVSARQVDETAQSLQKQLDELVGKIRDQKNIASQLTAHETDDITTHQAAVEKLDQCLKDTDNLAADSKSLTSRLLPQFRDALRDLLGKPGSQEAQMQETFIVPCSQKEKELEVKLNQVAAELEDASQVISAALRQERDHVERLKLLAEEEARRLDAERLQREEEERARLAEEERLRQEEEEKRRKEEEEALRRKQEEEEKARQALEEVERQRLEEEAKKRAEEEEAAKLAEERRLEAEREEQRKVEEEARLRAEEDAKLREEEEARKRAQEEEEKARRLAEEEARLLAIQQEEERLKILAQQLEDEQRRMKEEQELARQREEADRLLKEEQEAARKLEEEQKRLAEEAERQRRQAEEEERQRRIEEEEQRRRVEEEEHRRRLAELERQRKQEEEESARRRKLEEEELMRRKLEEEESARRRKLEEEELAKRQAEQRLLEEQERASHLGPSPIVDDIFSIPSSGSPEKNGNIDEVVESLLASIEDLRRRLRALSLEHWANPLIQSAHSSSLPNEIQVSHSKSAYTEIREAADELPTHHKDVEVEAAFNSLLSELETAKSQLDRCQSLVQVAGKIAECDASLSDLLEHVDGYPAAPTTDLQSPHVSDPTKPPEEQLNARVAFTADLFKGLDDGARELGPDARVANERERLDQTWTELQEMCSDRIANKSRPSTASGHDQMSGRTSSLSATSKSSAQSMNSSSVKSSKGRSHKVPLSFPKTPTSTQKTPSSKKHRGNLGLGPSPRPSMLSPNKTPRVTSSRTASVAVQGNKEGKDPKLSKKRSVSGPLNPIPNSNLYKTTYASRQRDASIASVADIPVTPTRPSMSLARSPFKTPKALRPPSPSFSEASSIATKARSASGYSRTTKTSFSTPRPPVFRPPVRKPYVANPKNKLDVAVGNVVNKMPVNVPIQAVGSINWEDKSGKYWIGDEEEAKLCFCRILRSQTVMVRVGGGWCELSKFLKDHFAHLIDQMPEPPNLGSKDQKWISASTLVNTNEDPLPPLPNFLNLGPPKTPEPKRTSPTVLLHTPSGASPRSVHSSNSPASPLAPLQFIRRAEESPIRSSTPPPHRLSKSTTSRTPARVVSSTTPAKGPHWRL